jgi:hypothetical protein
VTTMNELQNGPRTVALPFELPLHNFDTAHIVSCSRWTTLKTPWMQPDFRTRVCSLSGRLDISFALEGPSSIGIAARGCRHYTRFRSG